MVMANRVANADRCKDCGVLIAMVGIRHRCVPVRGIAPVIASVTTDAPRQEEPEKLGPRSSTYRYRNPEIRRAQMRQYMRDWRAKHKPGASNGTQPGNV
jgi:hypothetical protein